MIVTASRLYSFRNYLNGRVFLDHHHGNPHSGKVFLSRDQGIDRSRAEHQIVALLHRLLCQLISLRVGIGVFFIDDVGLNALLWGLLGTMHVGARSLRWKICGAEVPRRVRFSLLGAKPRGVLKPKGVVILLEMGILHEGELAVLGVNLVCIYVVQFELNCDGLMFSEEMLLSNFLAACQRLQGTAH